MSGLEVLQKVHLFPVRHHSPRTSAALRAFLDRTRPRAILIEGPSDATPLLDVLVDPETRPPVAILGYRTDGATGSALWPFAAYSPEYVAARWGKERGAEVAFIDVPIARNLGAYGRAPSTMGPRAAPYPAREGAPEPAEDRSIDGEWIEEDPPPTVDGAPALDLHDACARARGFRSFEEFWEASFEAPAYDPDSFREALLAYAELVRAADRNPIHRAREAFMARLVAERVAGGLRPEEVVVVVGAAHAAAFARGDVDPSLEADLPEPVPSASTIIPFSFPRLAEQLGYGAGNRAPQYYQRAHDAGCSFRRATLEVLVEFTEHLRLRGFAASLSDTIEAYRLAVSLAELRGKAEPGLDEVREATIATMCRGDATHVDGFLWPAVVGHSVGKVADRVGRTSLQEEFWREVRARGLPGTDALESFNLHLTNEREVATSIFLHRLRVAGVPYASYVGRQQGGRGAQVKEADEAGGEGALGRLNEKWEAQWTPATDVALVERIVLGDTLEQVASRVLGEALGEARSAGDAAGALLEAAVAGCPLVVIAALAACDRFAASDDDLPSLARAASVLSTFVSFGSSRALTQGGDETILALCQKLFDRAVIEVPRACATSDDALEKIIEALRSLHNVAMAQPAVDRAAWIAAAQGLVGSYAPSPVASGLACGLLYIAQVYSEDDVARIVGQRLSDALEPARAARFLQGFFEVNAMALVKSRPAVAALDAFLASVDPARFRDALPVLRSAFSKLGLAERRYLLENVIGARGLADKARAAQAVLLERDKDKLKDMSADLAKAMDDLDDLL